MIKILIVDDSDIKIRRIMNVISEFEEIPLTDVSVAKCQLSGKRLLCEHQYDLVILDVMLPNREAEPPQADGGVALLREIHSRTRYIKPYCIVGLTAYPDKLEQSMVSFGSHLWSVVLYDDISDQWEDLVKHRIEYLIEMKKAHSSGFSYQYDLAMITALSSPEFDAVTKIGQWNRLNVIADNTHYFCSQFESTSKHIRVVAACLPQMGMTSAAVIATKMIAHFKPRYFAMTGITAGIRDQVALGDVIVADPCWDWGNGKLVQNSDREVLEPDPQPHRIDSHLRSVFLDAQRDKTLLCNIWDEWQGNKPKQPPVLHIGPCVSGACVLANESIVKSIKEHSRKLLGVDMDAYGLMHAGVHSCLPHPLTFSIKGVSDFADKSKDDSYQEYASYVSAKFLSEISLKYFTSAN